ncbi:MAG: toxin-antitoxin system HicB family antitoxin [Oscillospiraceae bacterium]
MPYNESQKKATKKYNQKAYDEIKLRIKKGEKEVIKAKAESKNLSLNSYINQLIKNDMEKR